MNGKLYHHHSNHHYSNGPRAYEAPVVARSKSDDEGDEELISEEEEEGMEEENHSGLKPNLHLLKGHTDAVRALRMLPDGTTTTTFEASMATSLSCCYVLCTRSVSFRLLGQDHTHLEPEHSKVPCTPNRYNTTHKSLKRPLGIIMSIHHHPG